MEMVRLAGRVLGLHRPKDKLSDETLPVFTIIRCCGLTVRHQDIAIEGYDTNKCIHAAAAVVSSDITTSFYIGPREINFVQRWFIGTQYMCIE